MTLCTFFEVRCLSRFLRRLYDVFCFLRDIARTRIRRPILGGLLHLDTPEGREWFGQVAKVLRIIFRLFFFLTLVCTISLVIATKQAELIALVRQLTHQQMLAEQTRRKSMTVIKFSRPSFT